MDNQTFSGVITPEAIDECSAKVSEFTGRFKLPKSDTVRYCMAIEEILLKSSDTAGEAKFSLTMGKQLFREYITLEITGAPDNVYLSNDAEQTALGASVLKNLGLAPEYVFNGKVNAYTFKLKKPEKNIFFRLAAAIVLALLVGAAGYLLPEDIKLTLLDSLLTPLHDTFLNILGSLAGPMIFLSVAWGIYGIGDAATLRQIGKSMLIQYIGTVYAVITVVGAIVFPLFKLSFGESVNGSGFSSIFTMFLGFFPENIFSPFINGNTLQIICLAIVIGLAMLFLGQKTTAVAKAVEQINYIVQFIIEMIIKVVPYFIFIVLVKMIWSDMTSTLYSVGKLFAVFIGGVLVAAVLMTCYTALRVRANPFTLAKKGLPTFLIAFTTASSAAAFGSNMANCENGYGIDRKIISFGIPLGMVTFKPITAFSYVVMSLFFAESYNVPISPAWLVVLIFTAGVLAIATPPIPGGALASYTVLFLQLGIPAEALAIALACDALFDFIDTGFDQYSIGLSLLACTHRLGLVDREKLKKK